MRASHWVSLIVATGFAAVSSAAMAQDATAPARETPRPQDINPRVDTSAPAQSAQEQNEAGAEAAPRADSQAEAGAAAPGAARSSAPQSASQGDRSTPAATPSSTSSSRGSSRASSTASEAAAKPGTKGRAVDRLELDTTQITGNRELPKVLYIVPWKRSDLGDLVGKPINSLLDEVLTPVDRDVFQRENRYYRALTPGAAANDALSAPDANSGPPVRKPTPTNSAPAAGSPGSATYPTNTAPGGASTGSGSAAPATRDEK